MKEELTWRALKAMNTLYIKGKIPLGKSIDSQIRYLSSRKLIEKQYGNSNYLVITDKYRSYYEKNYLDIFKEYELFLQSIDPKADGRKACTIKDIQTLIFISEQCEELKKTLTTRRTFSGTIFKYGGSKYLENRTSLDKMVCKILGIEDFPAEDPKILQWRFVVDCISPNAIVLCENLDFLKTPNIARRHNIELWYVGGNNTSNIQHISPAKLCKPLYYSCDWDYDGLKIYCRIKDILKQKSKEIQLLYPSNLNNLLPIDSPHHNSKWIHSHDISGLDQSYFTNKELILIQQLIKQNQWIEEESNDLLSMLEITSKNPIVYE
jgi:hypothetical protein